MAADGLMSLNKIQWWFVYSENIYTSPMEGINPPTPLENSNEVWCICYNVWAFGNPPPPGNSNPFCGGGGGVEYGYFQELHIDNEYIALQFSLVFRLHLSCFIFEPELFKLSDKNKHGCHRHNFIMTW